jgi:hypothetical protein
VFKIIFVIKFALAIHFSLEVLNLVLNFFYLGEPFLYMLLYILRIIVKRELELMQLFLYGFWWINARLDFAIKRCESLFERAHSSLDVGHVILAQRFACF